ncbi:MAG: CHASE2 domain-containing protein, partial [Mariprofundaceae bacterium]|nr:CHASE2 domain-containing protein [Mariprofundaceae bacterium]
MILLNLGAIWKTDWFIGSMLTILCLFTLQHETSPLSYLENSIYDTSTQHQASTMNDAIAIINIHQTSLIQNQLTAKQALVFIINALTPANTRFVAITDLTIDSKGTSISSDDTKLTHAIQHAGNIVLPIHFDLSTDNTLVINTISPQLKSLALQHAAPQPVHLDNPVHAVHIHTDTQHMIQAAAGIGHTNIITDADGITRHASLTMLYGQAYFPSLPLILAANALNISRSDIRINMDNSI